MSKNRLQSKASRSQPSKTFQKPLHSCFGSSLGSVLEGFGWLLGSLGRLLGALRHFCAPLGRLLGVPWAFLGCLLSLFEASWAPLKRFGIDFGTFRGWFGRNLEGSGPQNNFFLRLPRLWASSLQMALPIERPISQPLASNRPRRDREA